MYISTSPQIKDCSTIIETNMYVLICISISEPQHLFVYCFLVVLFQIYLEILFFDSFSHWAPTIYIYR